MFLLSDFFLRRFRFGGNLSLCFHLPDSSRAYFLSPCFLSLPFSSFTLFYSSMGSSLLLIGELWSFVCGFVSPLVSLWFSSVFALLLLLPHMTFSPISWSFLCCVRITFVRFHFILDCGFYCIFSTYFLLSCLVEFFAVEKQVDLYDIIYCIMKSRSIYMI